MQDIELTEEMINKYYEKRLEELKEFRDERINHPSHYTDGKIEVIDYIEDKRFNFNLGNVIKYVSRAGKKENELEDLNKALWYLKREIERLENE